MTNEKEQATDPFHRQLVALRRNQILDAAAALFAEKGYHATTIRDIARQAGIADGTIYNYFASKPALLLGIFERMRETIVAQNPPPDPATLDIESLVRGALHHPLMALKENNFALFRIVVSEMLVNEELRRLYQQQILEPTLAGAEQVLLAHSGELGLTPLEARLVVRALSGMILGLILQYILGDPLLADEWERLPEQLANLVLHGLKGTSAS